MHDDDDLFEDEDMNSGAIGAGHDADTDKLLGTGGVPAPTGAVSTAGAKAGGLCSCLTIEYYKPWFDVDTVDVTSRIKATVLFNAPPPFLELIGGKPDLYGPFWTTTTLIFVLAVSSNMSAWMVRARAATRSTRSRSCC